jgi:hypothetical protein
MAFHAASNSTNGRRGFQWYRDARTIAIFRPRASAMNKNLTSSLERAISFLSSVSNLGLRIRFSLSHSSVGFFCLDGKITLLSSDRIEFIGEGCTAFVDRKTCVPDGAEDMTSTDSPFSFLWHFKLDGNNFFSVAGLEPFPKVPSGRLN